MDVFGFSSLIQSSSFGTYW
uniref:Uncharacterized protein n=1 Tax=Rhizophora mucronata TaxID=61149 RepID=A0A2P2ND13_RHIMU